MFRTAIALLATAVLASACARNLDGATYTSGNTVGKVTYGTIVSARSVTVKDSDKLEGNALGGIAGGALGGVAGSAVGKGTGRSLATVGGAILGAVGGAYAQDQLGTQTAFEYIVKLDAPRAGTSSVKFNDTRTDKTVAQDIKDSMQTATTESDAIAVVQTDATMLTAGTRVMVVYNDDRPRVIPAN